MRAKLRLPEAFAVVTATAFCGCSSAPAEYNCVYRPFPDAGVALLFRDGGSAEPASCQVPQCNSSLDGGFGQLVYQAPNGDQSPCMA